MDTVSVSDLITSVRYRANMEASQFVTDTEILTYLNRSYKELYDLLVSVFENYYVSSQTISIVSGTDSYSLPTDFYKALGVDIIDSSGQTLTLKPFNFAERNRLQSAPMIPSLYSYNIQGQNIKFIPSPRESRTCTLWYVPVPKTLVTGTPSSSETTTIDAINGYDEYIILDAAINCLIKEESDPSGLMQLKAETKDRIQRLAANRDAGEPMKIVDVYEQNFDPLLGW